MATSSSTIGGAPGATASRPPVKPRAKRPASQPAPQYLEQVFSTPTFKPGLDSSVEEYRKRLADILKKVEELQPEKYAPDVIDKNIGSFTVLPTYDQEGYLGGHSLEEIKEALEKRRVEIRGDQVAYDLAEKIYNDLSSQIENNEKEVARREKEAKEQAHNWGQEKLEEEEEKTEKIKNVIHNLKVERSKQFEKLKSSTGLLFKVKEALNFESKNPSSPLIPELRGRMLRYEAELKLIDTGLNSTIDNLSMALSSGPQDETFYKNGKALDKGETRSLLEIATTQKAREAIGKRNIGNEIREKNISITDQIHRLREDLADKRRVMGPNTQEAIFAILKEIGEDKKQKGEKISTKLWKDIIYLLKFIEADEKEAEKLEELFGPEISQRDSSPVLRGVPQLARLPADTPLSVEHIVMLGKNPISDLMRGISTHGKNIEVYEAWKKAWLDSGKIDTYRSENKTKGLWESDEKEAEQISTVKEMFNLDFELLKLEDFTTEPRLTDNFAQDLISYAKILSGVHNDKGNDIEWAVKHYEHAPALEEIKKRKAQLEEAINNKKNEGLKKQKQETAPKINKDLEFLSNDNSWEKELVDIRLSAFTKRSETERATLNIFKAEMETEMAAAARPANYNIPYIQGLLGKIEEKIKLLGSGGIMREMATKQLHYAKLFSSLSDDDLNTLGSDQKETIQKFKKDKAEINKIIFGVVNYGVTICNDLKAKATNIENKMREDINTKLAQAKNILSAMLAAKEKISVETLATYGIVGNDAQELIETLKKAGILK